MLVAIAAIVVIILRARRNVFRAFGTLWRSLLLWRTLFSKAIPYGMVGLTIIVGFAWVPLDDPFRSWGFVRLAGLILLVAITVGGVDRVLTWVSSQLRYRAVDLAPSPGGGIPEGHLASYVIVDADGEELFVLEECCN